MIYMIDLFCGAGGTTTGATLAGVEVIACVNHDAKAIRSHAANHPECVHYTEDIRTLKMDPLKTLVLAVRNKDPEAQFILWASLECTNFSKAKGGLPRDADSRTLADHLPRYITAIDPDFIYIENVTEFQSWGPLCENGKPINKKNGVHFVDWTHRMCELGYKWERKELNAADFGAYTSRNRLFIQFVRPSDNFAWPVPTHSKKPVHDQFGELKKWKPVKECLNFEDEGESIFTRKKPLSEKTLERIYAGLLKYVAGGKEAFLSKYYSGRPEHKNISIEGPSGTITCVDSHALVTPHFVATYHGNGDNVHSVESPSPTIPTKDSVHLIQGKPWVMNTNFDNVGSSIEEPIGVITANRKWHYLLNANSSTSPAASIENPAPTITQRTHYLMNPQYFNNTGDVEKPCFTLIARMDKAPPYLVEADYAGGVIIVYDTDSPTMVKIKEFMAMYGLCDISMRMLRVKELLKIQGFPDGYHLEGTQADQKKFIGNSVEVNCCQALLAARIRKFEQKQKAA